ncbi:MAG: PAS domain-containing protein [Piscinibacter sp.]|nr:PAS domain-containing protein [Piscinibacter sp.]
MNIEPQFRGLMPGERPQREDLSPAAVQEMAELFLQFAGTERHVLWVLDLLPHERVPFVSPAFESVWGRPAQALYDNARLWTEAIHPEDRPQVIESFGRWLADPDRFTFDCEYRIVRPDGGVRWIHDCGHVPDGMRPPLARVTGIAEDITERRRAQDALLAEQQRIAAMAAVAPSVLHTFRRGPNGELSFPYGGRRIEALYRLPEGTVMADAGPVFAMVHPEDVGPIAASIDLSARDMTPWRAEFRMCPPDGRELWIEGHSVPVRESDGAIVWHGTIADITERKRIERALVESRTQLAAVVANMTEGLVVCSAVGQLVEWNAAALAMHGLQDAEARGLTLEKALALFELRRLDGTLLDPADWPLSSVMRGQVLRQVELRVHQRRDDWHKVFSYSGSRVDDPQGQPLFGVIQCSDVTQRRRDEEELARLNDELEQRVAERTAQLQEAVRELEAFSYSVSHDLRAPLRALDGFSQALIEDHGPALPDDARRHLAIIRETAQKMGHLIDDLLDFARLNRASMNRRPVDCAALVRHAFDSLAHQYAGREVELQVGELPGCDADPALLRQVWVNLLSNAIKYSRQRTPARIEVGCAQVDGTPEYFVRDNGVGFDMRYVHKLFGVFERLHRADEFEGTGVGLAIVQRIVQRHGGRVRAQGEPGRGASFHFTLPGEQA